MSWLLVTWIVHAPTNQNKSNMSNISNVANVANMLEYFLSIKVQTSQSEEVKGNELAMCVRPSPMNVKSFNLLTIGGHYTHYSVNMTHSSCVASMSWDHAFPYSCLINRTTEHLSRAILKDILYLSCEASQLRFLSDQAQGQQSRAIVHIWDHFETSNID